MPGNDKPHQHILRAVSAWLQTFKGALAQLWILVHAVHSIQRNGHDCGVHMLINIFKLMHSDVNARLFNSLPKVRVWMYSALLEARAAVAAPLPSITEEEDGMVSMPRVLTLNDVPSASRLRSYMLLEPLRTTQEGADDPAVIDLTDEPASLPSQVSWMS